MGRRCFVIAPIGEPGSAVREHSDDVLRFIIEPAVKECGIEADRADHLTQPGKITDQMFERILSDDLCIAVVTGHNPNVFYEIAIAQAAGRPVILLAEAGEVMPFDLKDLRYVEYTMKPSPLIDGVYARKVVEHIVSLENAGWQVPPLFGELDTAGATRSKLEFTPQAHDFGAADVWMTLLDEAEAVFEIMGITLASWRKNPAFAAAVRAKAEAGCAVRILVMHNSNPALPELINETGSVDRLTEVEASLSASRNFYTELSASTPGIEVRHIRRGCAHFQLARNDTRATYIPYLFSRRSDLSPLLACPARHPFYDAMTAEFADLWNANADGA